MIAIAREKIILNPEYKTLGYIRTLLDKFNVLYCAVSTTWWTLNPTDLYRMGDLLCDPKKSPLLMINAKEAFDMASKKPEAYGKHELSAFAAAYHGNIIMKESRWPTSLDDWNEVNALLDR